MKNFYLIYLFFAFLICSTLGRNLDRCSLARELFYKHQVPRDELPAWTCIAEHESTYRTHVTGPPNTDDSRDYGIFQINDRYWCQPTYGSYAGKSSNGCGVSCDALLVDDLTNSIRCARTVKAQQGYGAWSVWKTCDGHLPSVNDCL